MTTKIFETGKIYRRTDTSTGAGLHGKIGEPRRSHDMIEFSDEFLVVEVRIHPEFPDFNWILVLGCNKEFTGWSPTNPDFYEEVTPEDVL